MKKIINAPEAFVDEFVEGILLAHPDLVKTPGDDLRILVRADAPCDGNTGANQPRELRAESNIPSQREECDPHRHQWCGDCRRRRGHCLVQRGEGDTDEQPGQHAEHDVVERVHAGNHHDANRRDRDAADQCAADRGDRV